MKSYRETLGRKSDFSFISNSVHIYLNVSRGVSRTAQSARGIALSDFKRDNAAYLLTRTGTIPQLLETLFNVLDWLDWMNEVISVVVHSEASEGH
jgi:hypothetical protein